MTERTVPMNTLAWARRAVLMPAGYLGPAYHARAWRELVEARGGIFRERRVRPRLSPGAVCALLYHSRHAHTDEQRAAAMAALTEGPDDAA